MVGIMAILAPKSSLRPLPSSDLTLSLLMTPEKIFTNKTYYLVVIRTEYKAINRNNECNPIPSLLDAVQYEFI